MLVIDHGLLEVVVNTVRELLTPFWNDEQKCLILHTPKFKYSRIVYNLVDLEYILRNRPDGWTDVWRTRTRGAVDSFVKLLSMLDVIKYIFVVTMTHYSIFIINITVLFIEYGLF
jgi:hypothetical protein